ncbi:5'-nucleotidase C-terminal domain-containing protein [Acuticoccus sp.]|uniref:5'-nucleotidase C-terminal domain-containing protein n=1 Tax=Acuticoccus sp. TaxID=1904378 RepID=UPI003B52AC3F
MNPYSDLGRLIELIQTSNLEVRPLELGTFEADSFVLSRNESAFYEGLSGGDLIVGARGGDQLGGGPGNDVLAGRGDDDLLFGGSDDDIVRGGGGDDTIEGGDGADVLLGGSGDDEIGGGEGDDILRGQRGDDTLRPGAGNNNVNGGGGEDTLVLDGLLSDYSFAERANGVLVVEARDGSSRHVVRNVEGVADEAGNTAEAGGTTTLQLLHATDLEGNADAVENAPNFATVMDALDDEFETTLIISSGDNYIPGPFSNAAGSADPEVQAELNAVLNDVLSEVTGRAYTSLESDPGRFDIAIMNAIGFDASVLGNHEFDFGQQQLLEIVGAETNGTPSTTDDTWTGALFPYLSANIVVEDESVLQPLLEEDGVQADEDGDGQIAPYAIIERGGERFGVIGATTQRLEELSSTRGDPANDDDDVTVPPQGADGQDVNDIPALAADLQPFIDELQAQGVNKIILTSHLQDIALEQQLVPLLRGVDIVIAGGSDTILADGDDRLREGDEAAGPYPILTQDADGNDVAIVSTDGQYTYVGRLIVEFDAGGNLIASSIGNESGPVATDEAGVLAVTGAATLDEAISGSTSGSQVRALVNTIQEAVLETSRSNFFGEQEVPLNGEREDVRTQETNLGNLTADANLAYARELTDGDVIVSLKNGGGIRASIPSTSDGLDGLISELEIGAALQFNNALTLLTLTPAQLLEVLEHALADTTFDASGNATNAAGRFAQVAGVNFSFDPAAAPGSRIVDVELVGAGEGGADVKIVDNGSPTAAADDFSSGIRIVTLSFLADGGDGYPYPTFGDLDRVDLEDPLLVLDGAAQFAPVGTEQDALAEYLADTFPVDGAPGGGFDIADTPPAEDMRIVNLALNTTSDLEM